MKDVHFDFKKMRHVVRTFIIYQYHMHKYKYNDNYYINCLFVCVYYLNNEKYDKQFQYFKNDRLSLF